LFQIVQPHNTSLIFVSKFVSQENDISDKISSEALAISQRVETVQSEKYKSTVDQVARFNLSQTFRL